MKSFDHYEIAYRKRGETVYTLVKNPEYGWAADPFFIEYEGRLYLFAEIYLYKSERNGVIAYCEYDGVGFKEWTVTMDKHWHLSYPNVWLQDGRINMCPESYQREEVGIYELKEFPDRWEKKKTLISNVEYCDSTFLKYGDEEYMFTFEKGNKTPEGKGYLYHIVNGELRERQYIGDSLEGTRCGGNIIYKDGKCIRVGQNCTREYGGGLIFYEIDSVWPRYEEHEIKRIEPEDVTVDSRKKYTGIHTYNCTEEFEVIDLKSRRYTLTEHIAQNRVRRVFLNKYH